MTSHCTVHPSGQSAQSHFSKTNTCLPQLCLFSLQKRPLAITHLQFLNLAGPASASSEASRAASSQECLWFPGSTPQLLSSSCRDVPPHSVLSSAELLGGHLPHTASPAWTALDGHCSPGKTHIQLTPGEITHFCHRCLGH